MVTLLASLAQAQEYSITLDDPTGVSNEGTIDIGTTVQFPLRWNVDGAIGGGRIAGFTNGFHVYSPGGGARWGNIVASMNPTYINAGTYVIFADTVYRPDGITPDTISFSGVSFGTGLQIPAGGFSGQVFFISVDIPNDPTIHNSVFCLDSVPSFPPTNNWKWSDGLVPANDIFPTFSGPHCYTIVDPSAPTNQAPVIGNLPDTAVTEGETLALTVTATDPDGTTPSLAALQLPAGATFDDNGDGTGSFSWVTEIGDAGVYTAIFEASDGELNDADTVQITVNALPPAVLVVEPLSFSFTAVEGGDNPGTQTLAIEEATARAVPFTVSKTNDWLTLSATDGTTPSSIQVGVDIIGLPADVYDDVIVVRSPDTEDSILVPVTLTVTAAPQFVLSPDTLYFSGVVGGDNPAGQDVLVAVEGDLAVDVTLSPLAAYIAVDPADLTTPALSSVTVDISALAEGDYFDSILVSEIAVANKDAEQIADAYVYVVTTISAAPEYILSPDTLYFTGEEGGDSPDAQDVSIAVTGDLAIATLLSTAAPYITVDPLNLTTPGVTSVSVDISTLVEGTYIDSILVAEAVPEPQEKDIEQTADAYIYVVTTILPPPPTTALVQIIHNAAGPALETVDVWVNDSLLLDNFTFRTATPFVSLPAEEQLLIEVSAFDDPTPLAIFDVTLAENQTYVFVANGVLEPAGFQANPDGVNITFTMYSIANARQVAANDSTVEFASLHGATDAPTVDITARGVATLLDDITYGEFVFYQSVPTASYILDVADSTSILASFTADLSSLGGSAAVVFASGFLTPADDQNGAPFGLFAALPNGTVIEFPPYEEPCTELLLQDSVFAFVAPQGGPATPESALLYVFGSIPGSDFDFSISGPTNDSVVSFFNATTSDSGSTVSGSAGDSIFIYVNTMSLSVGIYAFPYVVSSTDENVCEPASRDFAVLVTINEVIVPSDDTVRVVTVPAVPGMRVTVPVNFVNSCPVSMLHTQLVFNPTALYIDSVSLDASRVADEINTFNVDNNAGTLSLMTEADGGLIDIGSGNWVNLFVTVKCEAPGGFYGFVLDTSAGAENPMFVRDCGLGAEIEQTEYVGGGIVVDTVSNYVCGFVVDTAGTAIEGATVQLWGSFPFGAPLDQRFSSELGSFGFGNFTTVPFALYAFADGYYPALAENLNFGDKGIMLVLTPLPELTPTSQWVDYYCGTNTYRGQPLPIGSVVEAWVSDRGLLVGRQIVIEAGSYSFMTVYRANDQFGDDGALTGDMISFFVNGMPAIADGDVIYPAEYAEVQVCLAVGDVITQECTLQEGWNLVSWRIDTESDDLETVLGPYMDNIDVILGFERGGLTYDPDLTQFSTLWDVDHLSGYWIRVKDGMGFTLAIEGTAVPVSTPIPVTTGWNLVSYLPEMTMAPADALISLDGILLWAYGYDGGILTYSPTMPQFNTLTEMAACNGYWVKVSGNGTLVYPGASPVAFTSSYILPYESYGGRASLPTALAGRVSPTTEWVNLYSSNVTLDGASVTPGSRIEAFTADGKLVGSFDVVQPGTFGFMPVYGKTSDAEIGVEAGQSFYLEIDGARTNETFVWTGNGERIEVGALTSQSAGNNTVPETYSLAQNYPNPFNPSTVISFTMPSAGQARIDVFNILGHKVATVYDGMAAAGTTEVVWDGRAESGETVSSGVYFYRLTTDTFTDTKKMMLLK
jgi:hypothetical protein